jgi:predicted pyridoxine 5'-phosphate oxidase superfamily flavin-nucleotide-binding protein
LHAAGRSARLRPRGGQSDRHAAGSRGNNRIGFLRNIVNDPRIALLFLIPGVGRTIRITSIYEYTA